jgi:hypothetical protein
MQEVALYAGGILEFPFPLRERDRVRGKEAGTSLFVQTKSAVVCFTLNAHVPLADGVLRAPLCS